MPAHLLSHGDVVEKIEKSERFVTVNASNFLIRSIAGEFEITILSNTIDRVEVEEQNGKDTYNILGRDVIDCRIFMTPNFVKSFLEALDRRFKQYEEQFGSVEAKLEKPSEYEPGYIW